MGEGAWPIEIGMNSMSQTLRSHESEDGFTLVELFVVMLIIGLLAAIVIPAFFNQCDKASDTQAISDVRNL
jgi:type IV pilus assembly protein PilA